MKIPKFNYINKLKLEAGELLWKLYSFVDNFPSFFATSNSVD